MGIPTQAIRRPYAPSPDTFDALGNSSNQTFLGTGDAIPVRAADGANGAESDLQLAQSVEPPAMRPLPSNLGEPVVLPDGSFVPDRYSPTGQLLSPIHDLGPVAK